MTSGNFHISSKDLEGNEERPHTNAGFDFPLDIDKNGYQRPTIRQFEEIKQRDEGSLICREVPTKDTQTVMLSEVVSHKSDEEKELIVDNKLHTGIIVSKASENNEMTLENKVLSEVVTSSGCSKRKNSFPLAKVIELTKENKMLTKVTESSGCLKRKASFPPFCHLHPYGYHKWNLYARVEQKFSIQQYSSKKRMKLLLVDAEGTKLEASMCNDEIDRLQNLVQEGKVYTFTAVDVKNALSQYKLVKSDVECFLTKETEIEEQEDDNSIPTFSFKFVTFNKLHAFEGTKHLLIDVMAMVREVGPLYYKQTGDRQIPKRDILLVDKTLQHVKLVVFDKLAMLDSEWKYALDNSTIIVATALFVNCFRDFLILYGSYNSRVFFNPPIKDLENVKMSILEQLQGREIVSCSIGGANMVPVSLSCATRITIQDLKDFSTFDNNKCGLYEVVVTILKVYYDERNRLWYLGCGWCQKSLLEAPNTQYWCRKCEKFYNEGSNRYAFQMEIVDHSACHDVTVFDDVGEKLLGCKANFLADLCKKENSNVGVLERLRSITYGRYNLFVVVGGKDRSHISRPRHDISVVHCNPLDPAKEANYLLGVINNLI